MIACQKDEVVIECDQCGENDKTYPTDFIGAWQTFKIDGWKAKKIGDAWTHLCPRCVKENKPTKRHMFGKPTT